MSRPLARVGIDELEALFETNKSDASSLNSLVNELAYRNTPRATALLDKVQRVLKVKEIVRKMKSAEASTAPVSPQEVAEAPTPRQNGFDFEVPVFASGETSHKPRIRLAAAVPPSTPPVAVAKTAEPEPVHMSTEQAYRLLKVSSTSSWESVESARRDLVSRAQPDKVAGLPPDKRKALQEETRLVNLAYKQLMLARS